MLAKVSGGYETVPLDAANPESAENVSPCVQDTMTTAAMAFLRAKLGGMGYSGPPDLAGSISDARSPCKPTNDQFEGPPLELIGLPVDWNGELAGPATIEAWEAEHALTPGNGGGFPR
ncbi:hypothetical protein [Mangrovicoccus sp. HB161399]|uniref:hypothetical protein n=1 Tax=Mangrovicoccus sp. HB161399 TaxID=2720392 RepID=UPI001555BBCD|nr:hypothetical protein [Mangrovicoccus sp. HB161399]